MKCIVSNLFTLVSRATCTPYSRSLYLGRATFPVIDRLLKIQDEIWKSSNEIEEWHLLGCYAMWLL
jgi:hypothetical protein